jgi:MSHA biogenesis protein MshK
VLIGAPAAHAAEPPLGDPMRPFGARPAGAAAESVPSKPRFVLTAVLIAPSRRVAVVNGAPRLEGEAVDGATIVAIEPRAVRLRERGVERVVTLGRHDAGRESQQGESVP